MPFVMNQDIPETYEELKQAFIAECKERYENNEHSRQLLRELNGDIANLEREKEELEEEVSLINSEEMENEELIGELKAQIKELQEEKQRDTITEVRSARDKALLELKDVKELLRDSSCEDIAELVRDVRENWQELKELTEEVDRLKKMFCYSAVDMK